MPAETTPETQRKQISAMSDREVAEETLEHLRHVDTLMTEFEPLLGNFRISGLLAFRRARNGAGT